MTSGPFPSLGEIKALEASWELRQDEFLTLRARLEKAQHTLNGARMMSSGVPWEIVLGEYRDAVQALGQFFLSVGVEMTNFPAREVME